MNQIPQTFKVEIDFDLNVHTQLLKRVAGGGSMNEWKMVLFLEKVALALECAQANSLEDLRSKQGGIREIDKLLGLLQAPPEE
jgi:hypothetical protein